MLLALILVLSLAACRQEAPAQTTEGSTENQVSIPTEEGDAEASVYYLNHDPALDSLWQSLASEYEDATGIPVLVLTASESTCPATLSEELGKDAPPTLFYARGAQFDIEAALAFLNWCLTEKAQVFVDLQGHSLPYAAAEVDPLTKQALSYDGTIVPLCFWATGDSDWLTDLSSALTVYAANPQDENWQLVVKSFTEK